jgi:hypothetical protein
LFFCFQNTLKLTYEHLQLITFSGVIPPTPIKGEGRVLDGRREKDRWGGNGDKGGEEVIREERDRKSRGGRSDRGLGRKEREERKGRIRFQRVRTLHSKILATPLTGAGEVVGK